MRKVAILLVVALAMVAMVSAYTSASVVNTGTMAIVNTNSALLKLEPGSGVGNKDVNAFIDQSGQLRFDFRKGFNGNLYGMQPNSRYTWASLFWITNQSNDKVRVKVENAGFLYIDVGILDQNLGQWWGYPPHYGTLFVNDGANADAWVTLSPNTAIPIGVRFEIPEGASLGTTAGTLTVHAEAIE